MQAASLRSLLVFFLSLISPVVSRSSSSKPPSKDAILLSTVKSLTLRAGRQTSHRRVPSVPQVSCVGGTGAGLFEPDLIRCANAGSDYSEQSVQWTCTASLPPEFRLGATDVICEGYRGADDDWVLKGSCGVEYRLELTSFGEEKWPERLAWYDKDGGGSTGEAGDSSPIATFMFWCFFLAVLGYIIYGALIRNSDWWRRGPGRALEGADNRRPPGGGGGGGGGGGWWPGGGNDPPPPYTPHAPYDTQRKQSSYRQQNPAASGWRPGFWTGAASGAAAAIFANSMRNSNNGAYDSRRNDPGPSTSRSPRRSEYNGGSGGSASISSTRYESTGFGETRRR